MITNKQGVSTPGANVYAAVSLIAMGHMHPLHCF